jgi:hypothetical protein
MLEQYPEIINVYALRAARRGVFARLREPYDAGASAQLRRLGMSCFTRRDVRPPSPSA